MIAGFLLGAAILTGCSSSGGSAASTPDAVAATSSAAEPAPPPCLNPEGGSCVGSLATGDTHTTVAFVPAISYSAPRAGWSNYEDTAGNFLLVPPGNDLPGVNAGTSDFIGVYRAIAPSRFDQLPTCSAALVPKMAPTPDAMMKWLGGQSALTVRPPSHVTVGGLRGLVTDVRTKPGARLPTCREGGDSVTVFLLFSGVPPSSLDHGVIAGMTMRLYLLSYHGQVLAVEIDDLDRAPGTLADYSAVVERLKFGP
jgi:hypothetical protein